MADSAPQLEHTLLNKLAAIEKQIGELTKLRDGLRALVMDVRRNSLSRRDVTRSNSFDRILIENKILETLRRAGRAVPSERLFKAAIEANFHLKESTFRSHLHRMKNRGLIQPMAPRGYWRLTDYGLPETAQSLNGKSNS